jgi:hypothetical protein
MVYLQPIRRPYGSFYGLRVGLTARLKHCLEGSLKGTLGGISYVFSLCFMVLLKQLQRLYIGGFIFQVPLMYITAPVVPNTYLHSRYTNRVFIRSVHQPLTYASGALIKHWLIRGDASVYRPYSLLQYNQQSPSKRVYNTIRISCP